MISLVQVLEQLLLVTVRDRVKLAPQALPEITLTVRPLVGPERAPLPLIDQEYDAMPTGPPNWFVERGHTNGNPVIEQAGSGRTVKRTSLVSVQPLAWRTVNRNVAVAEKTCAVVVKELVESIVAMPLSTLQLVEMIG